MGDRACVSMHIEGHQRIPSSAREREKNLIIRLLNKRVVCGQAGAKANREPDKHF